MPDMRHLTAFFLIASISIPAFASDAQTLFLEGKGLNAQGFHARAAASLQQAKQLSGKNPALRAEIENELGNVHQLMGMTDAARSELEESISLAESVHRQDILASALNNLGNLELVENHPEKAAQDYAKCAEIAKKSGSAELAAKAGLNGARALERNGRDASSLLSAALSSARNLPDGKVRANLLLGIGNLYGFPEGGTKADDGAAYAALQEALAVSERIGDGRSKSYAQGFLGKLYAKAGRRSEALELTHRAIFAAEQVNAPEILYRWYWQQGRLQNELGKKDEAIASYRNSVSNLQSIRNDLTLSYASGESSFRRIYAPLYFELAELLLDRASTASGMEAERYLIEARNTVEKSKTAELQDYFRDSCVTARQSGNEGSESYGKHTAIVYPILLPDRLEILVTFDDGIREFRAPAGAQAITEEIRKFRVLLEKRTTRQYLPHAGKLYSWLIAPFAPELSKRRIDTLVFVPDGPLRTIPMSALHDGHQFLVERFAIATTPGVSLTETSPVAEKPMRVLLNGLTQPVQGFSALPNVGEELDSIRNEFRNATVLRDESYILPNMKRQMHDEPFSVVHIASHGQFKGDSAQTFILTHNGKLTLDQLQNLIAPTRYSREPLELLTLSACQTAAGDDRAALGLAGIAIKAGARSALASLWFINDSSSSLLIAKFYEHLKKPGETKAKALQEAQVDLIRDDRFHHPGYWAPFLMIGDWM